MWTPSSPGMPPSNALQLKVWILADSIVAVIFSFFEFREEHF